MDIHILCLQITYDTLGNCSSTKIANQDNDLRMIANILDANLAIYEKSSHNLGFILNVNFESAIDDSKIF